MKNTSNHPETENPAHASLSFDGCGINGRDEYRTRIATFTNKRGPVANHYGPLFAAAPEMLAALVEAREVLVNELGRQQLPESHVYGQIALQCDAAIARAKAQK